MRFLEVTHRLSDLMRKPGTTAGCIYHTNGKFMLDNSTLYHNHAGDAYSSIQTLDAASIQRTIVTGRSSSIGYSIVRVGKGSRLQEFRLQCGVGQEALESNGNNFKCSLCKPEAYLFGADFGVWEGHTLRNCSACPIGMVCVGGTAISAMAGFAATTRNETITSQNKSVVTSTVVVLPVM